WLALSLAAPRSSGGAVVSRIPDLSSYQYLGVIFLLLAGAEGLRGFRVGVVTRALLAAVLAISLVANLVSMHQGANLVRSNSAVNRAELAAVELAGPHARSLNIETPSTTNDLLKLDLQLNSGDYLAAAANYGSAAIDPGDIPAAPADARD